MLILVLALLLGISFSSPAQLNVQLLHQLVEESKQENERQNQARDKQLTAMLNEELNKSEMGSFKSKYRQNMSRFKIIGTAVDALKVGFEASPLVEEIISNQQKMLSLVSSDPLLLLLAYDAEIDMGERAYDLLNYLYALMLSISDIHQIKSSDRKLLFGQVIIELRQIAGASKGLLMSMAYAKSKKTSERLNPFPDFINRDKALIDNIIRRENIIIP